MEVISRLRIKGNENAFMIKDADVMYPIFSTSLFAAEIFNQMLSSGYKLCGLPFDFRKDGLSIMSLPVRDYTPTMDEEQDMYDIDSAEKMSTEEAREYISEDEVQYLQEPPTNYIYSTREEFLEFLRTLQVANIEEGVRYPINYFVHPNARFTVDEWRSGEYVEYFRIMEERRHINHLEYKKLRAWLAQFNPKAPNSAADFLEAYYAWGIDGINMRAVNMKRKVSYIAQNTVSISGSDYQLYYEDIGLVDRYGSVFPPMDINPEFGGWKVAYQGGKEDPMFRRLIANLKENEYGIAKIQFPSSEEVLELQGLRDTFTITPYKIISGELSDTNFVITTFDVAPTVVNHRWWSANWDNRVYNMSQLRAIAYSIVKQRKRVADVSSFKALMEVGLDIRGALSYIVGKIPNTTEEEVNGVLMEVEDPTMPTPVEIQAFVDGNVDRDNMAPEILQRYEFLDSIVNGEVNIDGTAEGAKSDQAVDVRVIYRYLYALYFCRTKVDMKKMRTLAENVDAKVANHKDNSGMESQVLKVEVSDGFVMNIPCPLLNAKIEGYNSDLVKYKVLMADQCSCFCKVTQVAREFGVPEANRHVAFEMKVVKLVDGNRNTVANQNLERLMKAFDTALMALPGWKQKYLAPYRRSSCMLEYFRVAEQGYMLLGEEMGNARIDFPPEFVQSVRSTITDEITSTALYCYFEMFNGMFTHFCVNADITPFKVYPKPLAQIPEVHISALWEDMAKIGGGAIVQNFTQQGLMYPNFVPWTYRYVNFKHFKDLSNLPSYMDLCAYKMYCVDYNNKTKATEEFVHAPHMETLLYGYYPSETERVDMGTNQRNPGSVPPLYVSKGTMLTHSMFPEHGIVQYEDSKRASDEPIRPFTGFDVDDFSMASDTNMFELPTSEASDKYLIVDGTSISTETQDNLPYYAIEQLVGKGYPIAHLWGRKYVFRDMYGSLWEVNA